MEAISAATPLLTPAQPAASPVRQAQTSFGDILTTIVGQANEQRQMADKAIARLHAGGEKNLHEAMIAMEKADITLPELRRKRGQRLSVTRHLPAAVNAVRAVDLRQGQLKPFIGHVPYLRAQYTPSLRHTSSIIS